MARKIANALYFSEKGRRSNNEDCIFPFPGEPVIPENLFIVCDGVGGAEKGEVASHLACESMAKWFAHNAPKSVNEALVLEAFAFTRQQFDAYLNDHPEAQSMGTTLVLVHFNEDGCTVAHCGDSRLYHIRGNRILWKTMDHTPVNEMLRRGTITPEEARNSPRTSIISRAIQGRPHSVSHPETTILSDIQPEDCFLLCSDGVWECFSNNDLVSLLSASGSDEDKIQTIKTLCEADSRDNYSAWFIRIGGSHDHSIYEH